MKCYFIISDQHTGHKNGLVNPTSKLEDNVPVPLYPIPRILWEITEEARLWVMMHYHKSHKWLIHLGETTQGNQHKDDLLTGDMSLQFRLAAETMYPFLNLRGMAGARFMQATSWHEYGDGSSSKLMVETLKFKYPKLDIRQMVQARFAVGDSLFEWTHHGSGTGKRKYLEGNSAFLDAKDRLILHLIEDERCPDITFTAHTHKPSKATASMLKDGEYVENTQIITPPMCGPGCYSRKVANQSLYYVGMHVVVTDGITWTVKPFYRKLKDYQMEVQ